MKRISFTSNHGVFVGYITVSVSNKNVLKKLMDELKKIDGIDKISRE